MKTKFFVTSIMAALALGANAQDFEVGVGISTFGLTLTPEMQINDKVGIRAPLGFASYSDTFSEEDVDLDATVGIGGFAILGDFYPTQSGFRLSGGLALPRYQLEGTTSGSIDFEGTEYTIDKFEANLGTEGVAPIVGLGYKFSSIAGSGWSGAIDLGAMFNVGYGASYDVTGLSPADQAQFDAEAEQYVEDIESEAEKGGGILPFVSVSISYKF